MRRERGQVLILVLVLLGIGAAIITPLLQMSYTMSKNRQLYGQFIDEDYAADAAIEYGMWRLKYEDGFASSLPLGEESDPFYINLNGIEASTTIIAQAPTGQLSGQDLAGRAWDEPYKVNKTVAASSTYLTIATDSFESGDGSHGTGAWQGDWTLSGSYAFNYGGAPDGNRYLWLYDNYYYYTGDGYAERQVMLSGSPEEDLLLQFYARVDSFESYHDDEAYVKISTDGQEWDLLRTFTSGDNGYDFELYQFDLSDYASAVTLYVAFETSLNSNHDYFYIDDVKFIQSQEAILVEPGVETEFTYYISIQCMDPEGCGYQDPWTDLRLDRITDILPDRGAGYGDYLQYVYGSTYWDEEDWGVPPFDPAVYTEEDWHHPEGTNQRLEWDFEDAGYSDREFNYGEVRTMTFKARAALAEGVYCNNVNVAVSYHWGWESDIISGSMAKIIVGDPAETRCSGGLLNLEKTVDPAVIYPDMPATVTYTLSIENVDTIPVRIYEIEDWLPSTGNPDAYDENNFIYVDDSAYGYILGRSSLPVLFYDTFNRQNSYTVSYWIEEEDWYRDCQIYSNAGRMSDYGSIAQTGISTAGNIGIVLSYDWKGSSTESSDRLRVEWKPSSSETWNLLAEHGLNYTYYWHDSSHNLPATADDTIIDIRFTGITDQSNEYVSVDNVQVRCSDPVDVTPVCMPDVSDWPNYFFSEGWDSSSRRWMLDWNFNYYPDQGNSVWDIDGPCGGYLYAGYSPYLELQPGEVFVVVFQADVTLFTSGSYYNEFFVRINQEGHGWWDDWLYSWPTGGVTVPQYDLQAETLGSVLRAAAMLNTDGFWWRSWHWWKHR